MSVIITSLSIAIAAILFILVPKLYEHNHNFEIHGHVEPGFEKISDAFKYNFDKRFESMGGASFAAYYNGKMVADIWGGYANIKGGKSSLYTRLFGGRKRNSHSQDYDHYWLQDTLANTLSITKGMVAIVIGHLQDQGKLNLNDPVVKFWPQFANHGKANITIAQILSHTAGLPYIDPHSRVTYQMLKDNSLYTDSNSLKAIDTELGRVLANQKPAWDPGTRRGYHVFTLGLYMDQIVRRCDVPKRRSLSRYFEDEIAKKFDLDYYIGLSSRDLNPRVAILRNEPYFKSILGMYQKFRFGLMIYTHPMTKKAMMNPDFIVKTQSMALNRPEIRALQFPSVIGIGDARSLAKIYGILANGGTDQSGQQLLKSETIRELSQATSTPCTKDIIFGDMYKFALATGFILIPNPDGKWNFGFPGHGLQLAFADPHRKLGYAYITNTIANDQLNDQRGHNLVKALYKALNSTSKHPKLEDLKNILAQETETLKETLKSSIENENDVNKKPLHGSTIEGEHGQKLLRDMNYGNQMGQASMIGSAFNYLKGFLPLGGSSGNIQKSTTPDHESERQRFLENQVRPVMLGLASKFKSAHTGSDLAKAIETGKKSIESSKQFAGLFDVTPRDPSYFLSMPYLEGISTMIMEAQPKLKSNTISGDEKNQICDVVLNHLLGIEVFDKVVTSSVTDYSGLKKAIHESIDKLKHAKTNEEINKILGSISSYIPHKLEREILKSDNYFKHTSSMIIEAAKKLSGSTEDEAKLILDQVSQYMSGLKPYLSGSHHKGYFEIAGDKLSDMFGHLYPHHKKGYLEKTKDTILKTAVALQGAKSAKDVKHYLDEARKSITSMSDQFINHKIPDSYYDSKEYIQDTSSMLLDAANKLAKSSNDEAHSILDQASQYITGVKQYIPGMHQKGYFQIAGDKLSDMFGHLYPHHKKGYLEKTKDTILKTAVALQGAKSAKDVKHYLDEARKSITSMSDQFINHKIPDSYYDSKEYIQDTSSMLLEAANKLAKSTNDEAHAVLDHAGQYITGIKEYIPGMKDKTYFERLQSHLPLHSPKGYIRTIIEYALPISFMIKHKPSIITQIYHMIVPQIFRPTGTGLLSLVKGSQHGTHYVNLIENLINDVFRDLKSLPINPFYHKTPYHYNDVINKLTHYIQDVKSSKSPNHLADIEKQAIKSLRDIYARYLSPHHQPALKERLNDGYYDAKSYLDSSKVIVSEAARKLPNAAVEDVEHLIDQLGISLLGLKDLVYHKHPQTYYEKAASLISEAIHKLEQPAAKTSTDYAKSILRETRNGLLQASNHLNDLWTHKSRHESWNDKISDAYYDSKKYVDSSVDMLLEASKHITSHGSRSHSLADMYDQAGKYLLGLKDYTTHRKGKGYFEKASDKIFEMKDSLISNFYPPKKTVVQRAFSTFKDELENFGYHPHQDDSYYEKAKETVLKLAPEFKKSKSESDLSSLLDKYRKSLLHSSDHFMNLIQHKRHHTFADSVSDSYFNSKDYIKNSIDAVEEAAHKLSQNLGHKETRTLLDRLSEYLLGLTMYHPSAHRHGYFDSAYEGMKGMLTFGANPSPWEHVKHGVSDLFYPPKPSYYERAKLTITDAAHAIEGGSATTYDELKALVNNARNQLATSSEYFTDLLSGSKHKQTFGDKLSHALYDSKDYVENNAAMLVNAAKRLSSASAGEAEKIMDQVGEYMIGFKDMATGRPSHHNYFDLTQEKLSHVLDWSRPKRKSGLSGLIPLSILGIFKGSLLDHVLPHKKSYFERARNVIIDTTAQLQHAKSESEVKHLIDAARKSLIDSSHYFTSLIKSQPPSLGGRLSDSYYDSKAYVDATVAMLKEASEKLPQAAAQDTYGILDQAGQYLIGLKDYVHHKIYPPKSFFEHSKESFESWFKPSSTSSWNPHEMASGILDSISGAKEGLIDALYSHPPSYYDRARETILRSATQLRDTLTPNQKKSILERARHSLSGSSHHFDLGQLGGKISSGYYDTYEYVESSAAILLEAAQRLAHAGTDEAKAILDTTGQYLVGLKGMVTQMHSPFVGHKPPSLRDRVWQGVSTILNLVCPPKKGTSYLGFTTPKAGIYETVTGILYDFLDYLPVPQHWKQTKGGEASSLFERLKSYAKYLLPQ